MSTPEERFRRIEIKLERANDHIRDLKAEMLAFRLGNPAPYEISTKPDGDAPDKVIYYFSRVTEPPLRISAIAGDVLFNFRASLDYLVLGLVENSGFIDSGSGASLTEKEIRDISFPISDTLDPKVYEASALGKIKGASKHAQKALLLTKAYKGGNPALWRLHRLNNIDKHRAIMTAAATVKSHNVPNAMKRSIIEAAFKQLGRVAPSFTDDRAAEMPIVLTPRAPKCPLKAGDEIITAFDRSIPFESNENLDFTFDVAFNEPQVAECQPILETVDEIADCVKSLILSFRYFFL
jgi:hypothetical protein